MKVLVVSRYCEESSRELVEALQEAGVAAQYLSPSQYESKRVGPHILFAYGWSGPAHSTCQKRINGVAAVLDCIDKENTLYILHKARVKVPRWANVRRSVLKEWNHVVVRQSKTGRKAEGFAIIAQCDGETLTHGELYTEYFYHRQEYRVVVFMGKCVGVYFKREGNGEHVFIYKNPKEYPDIVRAAKRAAKALNIDYVGFDVVAKNKRSYVFLEANSGPILADEACKAIVQYFKD